MLNPKVISPLFHQNTKGALLRRIIPLSIIIGLLIFYKYFVELTYEIAFPSPNTPINPVVPTIPNITIPNINDDIEIDPLFTKKHENKFRVKLEELKEVYQVMDIIRIIIEPRHPSLANKLESTFFRVTITGTTIFTPQLVSSSNSSVLVYEAPLMDQGDYNVQVRMIFYDYKEIYSFESSDIPDPNLSPKVEKIDRVIINGEFKFKVEQSPVWARLKSELPESCADISILRGRWTRDLSQFIPYSCIIPNYYTTTFLETDPKFISDNNNNLPFRYTWLRFLGDSNTRRLFSIVSRKLGTSCIKIQDGQNKDKNTQIFCKANYTQTKFLGEKDPRPREIYLTYEWYYPRSKYSLETLLNNTFEQTCKQHDKCMKNIECDFTNSTNNNSSKNICSTERADYTFISLGSHTPGWNIESIDKYLEGIFQQIHENYREKLTFITTNVANINKIPPYYKNQYLIRNNFRITKANELLKKYVDKSQKGGYNNIDLLDFFGTTKPIYEYSGDAVHYKDSVYNEQTRLVLDRLVNYIRTIH